MPQSLGSQRVGHSLMTEQQQNQSFLNSTQLEFGLDNPLPWGDSGHPVYCRMLAVSLASTKYQECLPNCETQKMSTDIGGTQSVRIFFRQTPVEKDGKLPRKMVNCVS